ncbi:MAG: glycosyltransferase family 4 protein [Candidatus Promineofilum sp.]|nr:glycosyltransferase family 4 protein [Promineifilum sp.]
MAQRILHQFAEGAFVGDATSDQAFMIQRWLQDLGFVSEIYVEQSHPELAGMIHPVGDYRPHRDEKYILHHHAIGSAIAERIKTIALPQILIYHNITPTEFYAHSNPTLALYLDKGRRQLAEMVPRTALAVGDSGYNEAELIEAGFSPTGTLPIVLDESTFDQPLNEALAAQCSAMRPLILFVGRMAPNKRQEDLLKLHFYLHRFAPRANLVLVGNTGDREYVDWQEQMAKELRLDESSIHIAGHVSHQDMLTYYRCADVYVSMSEHEGFGKPLIESMYCGLPVVAYASSAVPETMGDAGILFYEKDYEALAELVDILVKDEGLRGRIIARQTSRAQDFLEPQVRRQFEAYLRQLGLLPDGSAS